MAQVNIGRYRTSPEGGFVTVAAGKLLGNAASPTTQHLWGKRFRVRMGRLGASTPSVRVALYAKSGSAPAQLLGYSGVINPSTAMTTWDGGAFYESDVAFCADGPSNNSIPIPSGTIPVFAVLPTGADLGIGQFDSDGSLYDPNHYSRTGLSTPPDPFGSASVSVEGNLTISLYCDENEAPVAPINRGPSGTINEIDDFPMYADFRDRNGPGGLSGGTDLGDYMYRYKVQVRRQSDAAVMWDPAVFNASPAEIASDHFEVDYAGTVLTRGVTYEWKTWQYDHFNAKGGESSWLAFTPANQGFVTLNGNPVSTVIDNTPDFDFSWTHQSSESTNSVRLQLYQGNTLAYTSGIITDSTASGASGQITWAESGLGTLYASGLPWGQTWKYEIQGRDTSGNWSDYSARRQFKTDASPSIPDGLSPANDEIVTDYPLLTFQLSDADNDSGSGLVGKVRIRTTPVVPNPSFATDFSGWAFNNATAGITYAGSWDGALSSDGTGGSGKIAISANSSGAGSGVVYRVDEWYPVEAGEVYVTTMQARTDNTNVRPVPAVRWYESDQTTLITTASADTTYAPTINTWQLRTMTATAPALAKWARLTVLVYLNTSSVTGNAWWDVYTPESSIRRIRTATYNATSGLWEVQTDAEDLPDFGDVEWNAYGYDGTLYSGAVTSEASAVKSPTAYFTFADGPTAEITSPTDGGTITSSTPTVTWTSTDQNRYRLTFYETGTTTVAYQRGWVVSAAQEWTVPAGYLHNNHVYDIELIVEDNQPLQGFAQIVTVEGAFTGPPAATGFSATPIAVDDNDPWPTAIQVQWDATSEPGGTFVGYYLYRDDIGLTGRPYKTFPSPDQTSWVDPVPASGREYTYALRVVGQRDLDRVTSARVYASATVTLKGVVLCDVNNPYTYRAVLDDVQSRDRNRKRDEQTFMVGANKEPITFRSPTSYWEIPGEYRIIPPNGASEKVAAIAQRAAALDALEEQDPVVCYRDERGTVLFGRIINFTKTDNKFYPVYSFGIRSEAYTLGVRLDQEISE